MRETYKDDKGYLRFEDNGELVHRKIAFNIYKNNSEKYPLPFGDYVIHHINGNKLDNKASNLDLLTTEEHNTIHNEERINTTEEDKKEREFNYFIAVVIIAIIGAIWMGFSGIPFPLILISFFAVIIIYFWADNS